MKYAIAALIFSVNLLGVPVLFYAIGAGWMPWWCATIALVLWTWLMLPGTTWRDYTAGGNIYRVKRGGKVTLPPDDQCKLEPDHQRLLDWQLYLPAVVRNFLFNATWGWLYFGDAPREVGFTRRINRYRAGNDQARKEEGERVAVRWLHRFDSRGFHS